MHHLRLTHPKLDFWVDVRLRQVEGRWLASADTPDGPTIGYGDTPMEALVTALDDYAPVRGELLASLDSNHLPGAATGR